MRCFLFIIHRFGGAQSYQAFAYFKKKFGLTHQVMYFSVMGAFIQKSEQMPSYIQYYPSLLAKWIHI